jgi:hypothetical protein
MSSCLGGGSSFTTGGAVCADACGAAHAATNTSTILESMLFIVDSLRRPQAAQTPLVHDRR